MPLPLLTVLLYCVKTDESACEQAYSDSARVKKQRKKKIKASACGFIFYFSFASVHLRVYLRTFGCTGRGDIAGGGTDTVIPMCPSISPRNSIHILAQSPTLALDSTPSGRLHFVTKSEPTQLYSYSSYAITQECYLKALC